MEGADWAVLVILLGAYFALTESNIRRSEDRIARKLDRMHDQLIGVCKKLGVDPVNPLDE